MNDLKEVLNNLPLKKGDRVCYTGELEPVYVDPLRVLTGTIIKFILPTLIVVKFDDDTLGIIHSKNLTKLEDNKR